MERLALTTVLSFYKSDYFPSAFKKKKKTKNPALVSDSQAQNRLRWLQRLGISAVAQAGTVLQ